MTVAELERLLSTLPGDTVVTLRGAHVEYIYRKSGGEQPARVGFRECGEPGHPRVPVYEQRQWPATIDLGATINPVSPWREAPAVRLAGRWPRASREALA